MKIRLALLHLLIGLLIYIVTSMIQVPLIGVGGYFNLGDIVIMLIALVTGKVEFFIAVGLGSALADYTSNWAQYAIFTGFIKAALYLICYYGIQKLGHRVLKNTAPFLLGAFWISISYGFVEKYLNPQASLLVAIQENALQGFSAAIITILMIPLIEVIKQYFPKLY